MRILFVLAAVLSLSLFTGCPQKSQDDNFESFLKDTAEPAKPDEALTIVEETQSAGDAASEDMAYSALKETAFTKTPAKTLTPEKLSTEEPRGSLSVAEIKDLLGKAKYRTLLKYEINESSAQAKYYYGIAYFILAKEGRGRAAERADFADKAAGLFKEAGKDGNSAEFKSKAVLWHGITLLRLKYRSSSTSELLKPFIYITDNYRSSRCFNDALFYMAQIYRLKGENEKAEDVLGQMRSTAEADKIYDVRARKWVSPESAYTRTMAMIGKTIPVEKHGSDDNAGDFAKKIEKVHQQVLGGSSAPVEAKSTVVEDKDEPEVTAPVETASMPSESLNNAGSPNGGDTEVDFGSPSSPDALVPEPAPVAAPAPAPAPVPAASTPASAGEEELF